MTDQTPRYVVTTSLKQNMTHLWVVYDTKTDTYLRQGFHEEYMAQEKANELNRLKSPH